MNDTVTYSFQPHKWHKSRGLSYQVCSFCGLVALKNYLTIWSIDKGCDSEYHPTWQNVRVDLVKKWQERT